MASGGYDRSVDSRVTCSICLEPYRGRQPKLLPCSHTFCLPCLTQIADKERQRLIQISGEEDEERDVSITCPTCRTPISLPPTGVSGLHANVYVDDAGDPPDSRPILCDLCEEGHKAQLRCATCKTYFDTRCRRIHDKLCKTGQVSEVTMKRPQASYSRVGGAEEEKEEFFLTRSSSELDMMESLLRKLREKEKKNEQKMKKSGSRQALKSVSSSEASLTEDLEPDDKSVNPTVSLLMKKMMAFENQLTVQQNQLSAQQSQITGLQNQNTLLTSLNDKHDKEITTLKSASKKDRDAMTTLEREVASLRDKNAILCQDKEQLRSEVTKLKDDVTRVRDYCTTLQVELDKLQGGQGAVQSDIVTLQTEQNTMTTEQNIMKTEQGKLHTDLKKMQTDFAALKTEQGKSKGGDMKLEVDKLKKEVDEMKQKNSRMEKDSSSAIATLTKKLGAFSKQVAFQAILSVSSGVTLKKGETLICGYVISSVGGGYDPKTGVFTVPVAGVYCFMFTSRCVHDAMDKSCALVIMLDNKDIAFMQSFGKGYSTAHAVIHASAVQKVFLRSHKDDNSFCFGWGSTFTGFLLYPDV